MEFQKIIALAGPNIWARFPVLEAWIELGDLKDSPSNEMPGFNDRVMSWLPMMIEHRCSIGERGGFFERLRRGTYLAHILEHVTLELQARAGTDLGFGRARETRQEGLFRVAVRYEDEEVGRACLEAGRQLCLAAAHNTPYDVNAEIARLRILHDDVRLGPSTRTVVEAARARGIPARRLSAGSLVQLGHGIKQKRIHRSATEHTGAVAESVSDDKEVTKAYLRSAGLPVAAGRLVTSPADAWQAAQEIGTPVVVKPKDGNYGNGVVIGISKREQIEAAYEFAAPLGTGVMVERLAHGAEHRLLVVGGKFVAATRGNPAHIVGDGKQNVRELIESQLNSDPRRGPDLACPLSKIELDATVLLVLEQEGYTLDSVPAKDKKVMIQRNGNLAVDVTDSVHAEVAQQAGLAARVIGLDVAGIDIIADDIGRPLAEQGGVIIEVNAGPGLQMHVEPEIGTPRPVGEAIVATLYPPGDDGRIPLVAVTGADDTSLVTKLVIHLLSSAEGMLGAATANGTFVGETRVAAGDSRDAASARSVLLNPLVDRAVFEISPESIVNEGLGFDHCRVAVITAMGDGWTLDLAEGDTPEKKALAYRGLSDMVLPTGAVVLAADEPLGPIIAKNCPGAVILFAPDDRPHELNQHRATRGRVVFARQTRIVLADGFDEVTLDYIPAITITAQLPAIAAAWGAGLSPDQIASRLRSFPPQV